MRVRLLNDDGKVTASSPGRRMRRVRFLWWTQIFSDGAQGGVAGQILRKPDCPEHFHNHSYRLLTGSEREVTKESGAPWNRRKRRWRRGFSRFGATVKGRRDLFSKDGCAARFEPWKECEPRPLRDWAPDGCGRNSRQSHSPEACDCKSLLHRLTPRNIDSRRNPETRCARPPNQSR